MRKSALFILLCVAACSEIAGLGDERNLSDAATGGSGGSGGSAASGGAGGTSGVSGQAGADFDASAGTAGTGGGAGSAGSSGSAGSAGSSGSSGSGGDAGGGGTAGLDAGGDACGADLESDPNNCGYCGHDCLGGACDGGECQPVQILSTPHGGWSIGVGADAVFWTNQFNGNFFRLPKKSSSAQTFPSLQGPKELAVVGNDVFVASPGKDWIYRAPTDGSAAPSAHFEAPSGQPLETLAADSSGVYFDAPNAIYRTNGQTQSLIASAIPQPTLIATDASYVYFTTADAGEVHRVPKTGAAGPLTPIATAGTKTRALTVDDQWLYFGTFDAGSPVSSLVYRTLKNGGGTLQLIGGGDGTRGMVRVGPYLYWADQGTNQNFTNGKLQRARVDGATPGAVETVASDQNRPHAIAADGSAVYWLNAGWPYPTAGSVWRVAL